MTPFEDKMLQITHRTTNALAEHDLKRALKHTEQGVTLASESDEAISMAYKAGLTFLMTVLIDSIEKKAMRDMMLKIAQGAKGVKN